MAALTDDQLRSNLCSRDPRNPYFADLYGDGTDPDFQPGTPGVTDNGKPCACDNCFYGRTPMADTLLRLRELLAVRQAWDDYPLRQDHPSRAHPMYPGTPNDSGCWARLRDLRAAIHEAAGITPFQWEEPRP